MTHSSRRRHHQVAIVTGATGGIGKAVCRRLLRDGLRVMLADLDRHALEHLCSTLEHSHRHRVSWTVCDVSDQSQVEQAVEATLKRFGHWDLVVNNAGIIDYQPLTELTGADWHRIFDVDLLGAFYFTRQALLRMRRGGAIVNVSSVHAAATEPLLAPYAAAKAAMLSLTRSTALEGRPRGIRANAILPGAIDTPMLWDSPSVRSGSEQLTADDVGSPEAVAAVIAFLGSPDARFVNGATLLVDGARRARL